MPLPLRGNPRIALALALASGLLLFIACSIAGARGAAAKEYKGNCSLTGVVLGPDDKPVARAVVTYQSSSGSLGAHVRRTDSKGHFAIVKLPADIYDLRASANGLFSEWEKNVTLGKGQTKSVTLRLIYTRGPVKPPSKKQPKQ